MMSSLLRLRDALNSIEGLKVYHYWRPRLQAPYCVWAEDGEGDSIWSDNHQEKQIITGTIDYFTLTEYDQMVESIQNALNETEVLGWSLSSVDYEPETNLIHYSWDWETL